MQTVTFVPYISGGFMKYIIFSFLTPLIILSGCAAFRSSPADSMEIFEGTGQGYRGPVTVQVQMAAGQIIDIVIIDCADDRSVGYAAMEELAGLAVMYNSANIDAVTGATESSRGFLEAVENAILKK